MTAYMTNFLLSTHSTALLIRGPASNPSVPPLKEKVNFVRMYAVTKRRQIESLCNTVLSLKYRKKKYKQPSRPEDFLDLNFVKMLEPI